MKMNAPHPFYRAGSLSFCAAALALIEIAAAGESNSTEFCMYKEPQQLVEVEPGRKLNLVCMGEVCGHVPVQRRRAGAG